MNPPIEPPAPPGYHPVEGQPPPYQQVGRATPVDDPPPTYQPPTYLPPTYPPPPYAGSSRPARTSTHPIAVTALVLSILALVLVALAAVGAVVAAGVFGGGFGGYDLIGTAPQVVDGQSYPGSRLADEVQRVLEDDGWDVGPLTCPDVHVAAGTSTQCTGEVDGSQSSVDIELEDDEGHFTITSW